MIKIGKERKWGQASSWTCTATLPFLDEVEPGIAASCNSVVVYYLTITIPLAALSNISRLRGIIMMGCIRSQERAPTIHLIPTKMGVWIDG